VTLPSSRGQILEQAQLASQQAIHHLLLAHGRTVLIQVCHLDAFFR
jgi:hypothetical protein